MTKTRKPTLLQLAPTLFVSALFLGWVSGCGEAPVEGTEASPAVKAQLVCDDGSDDPTCARGTTGDTCQNPIAITVGTGSAKGTTVGAADDGTGTCGQPGGPDRVYTFTLTEAAKATFDMPGNPGYDTLLHLRTSCADASTQIACNDDDAGTAAGLELELQPGTYFLYADSYGKTGNGYTLNYSFRANPCAANPCGEAECVPAADWSAFTCRCPAGQVLFEGACIDDPCDPNPCTIEHMTRCTVDGPGEASCDCNPGYILGQSNTCVVDPNLDEWTFMVYLNADNNLESYGFDDLDEMETVGSTDKINIVVLMDTASGSGKKLYVTKGNNTVLADMGELDMGIPQTLASFGTWAIENYPARRYALVMWNHGGGWNKDVAPIEKNFSNDDSSGNAISIANGQYAAALAPIVQKLGRRLDLVGFDACLMGMWELADASAPYADVLVASEETEPGAGWSYDRLLAPLAATPTMSAKDLSKSIVDTYFANSSNNVTLASIDLTLTGQLDAAVSLFANELTSALSTSRSQISTARNATQKFYYSDNRDLWDFASRINGTAALPASLKSAAQALIAQLGVSIIHNKNQTSYPGAHGMAINLPSSGSGVGAAYRGAGAVWSQNTTWDEFLAVF